MQEHFFQQSPKLEKRFSSMVLGQAEKIAQEMRRDNDTIREVPIGEQSEAFWITRDPNLVVGSQILNVDGERFYLGLRKESEE